MRVYDQQQKRQFHRKYGPPNGQTGRTSIHWTSKLLQGHVVQMVPHYPRTN